MKKARSIIIAVIILTIFAAGCAANKSMDSKDLARSNSSRNNYESGEGFVPPAENNARGQDDIVPTSEKPDIKPGNKIIKSAIMEIETLEFDKTTGAISKRVDETGGYIESSNIQGKSKYSNRYSMRGAVYKIRIPSEKFEFFIDSIGELGNILRIENFGKDITDIYYDTEARLNSLEIQEERLLDILKDAEKLSDIIELERELSKVRYEIEQHTGSLRKWDNLVDYSTLELIVNEVEELKEDDPSTMIQKIVRGFKNSVKNVANIMEASLVFIISSLPYLVIIIALFVLIACFVYMARGLLRIIRK